MKLYDVFCLSEVTINQLLKKKQAYNLKLLRLNMQGQLQLKLSQTQSSQDYFRVALTPQQVTFLVQQLPKKYSIQLDNKHPKRVSTKSIKQQSIQSINEEPLLSQINSQVPARFRKVSSNVVYNQEIERTYSIPKTISMAKSINEDIDEQLKPCLKILNSLKNCKNSWPFREPVDPIVMGVPHYHQIISQPMDLQTVQNNLRTNQYVTATQFHADINKIIRNSYTFNKNNQDFIKITTEFEKFYFKTLAGAKRNPTITSDQQNMMNNQQRLQKKKKKSFTMDPKQFGEVQPPTLAQKKELSQQIRRLNKEDLRGVVQIVYAGQSQIQQTFDIQDLQATKIRELQKYVRSKIALQDQLGRPQQKNEGPMTHQPRGEEQSSFDVDSDS